MEQNESKKLETFDSSRPHAMVINLSEYLTRYILTRDRFGNVIKRERPRVELYMVQTSWWLKKKQKESMLFFPRKLALKTGPWRVALQLRRLITRDKKKTRLYMSRASTGIVNYKMFLTYCGELLAVNNRPGHVSVQLTHRVRRGRNLLTSKGRCLHKCKLLDPHNRSLIKKMQSAMPEVFRSKTGAIQKGFVFLHPHLVASGWQLKNEKQKILKAKKGQVKPFIKFIQKLQVFYKNKKIKLTRDLKLNFLRYISLTANIADNVEIRQVGYPILFMSNGAKLVADLYLYIAFHNARIVQRSRARRKKKKFKKNFPTFWYVANKHFGVKPAKKPLEYSKDVIVENFGESVSGFKSLKALTCSADELTQNNINHKGRQKKKGYKRRDTAFKNNDKNSGGCSNESDEWFDSGDWPVNKKQTFLLGEQFEYYNRVRTSLMRCQVNEMKRVAWEKKRGRRRRGKRGGRKHRYARHGRAYYRPHNSFNRRHTNYYGNKPAKPWRLPTKESLRTLYLSPQAIKASQQRSQAKLGGKKVVASANPANLLPRDRLISIVLKAEYVRRGVFNELLPPEGVSAKAADKLSTLTREHYIAYRHASKCAPLKTYGSFFFTFCKKHFIKNGHYLRSSALFNKFLYTQKSFAVESGKSMKCLLYRFTYVFHSTLILLTVKKRKVSGSYRQFPAPLKYPKILIRSFLLFKRVFVSRRLHNTFAFRLNTELNLLFLHQGQSIVERTISQQNYFASRVRSYMYLRWH